VTDVGGAIAVNGTDVVVDPAGRVTVVGSLSNPLPDVDVRGAGQERR
jgi:hypothetical protein